MVERKVLKESQMSAISERALTNFGTVSTSQVFKTPDGEETIESLESVAIRTGLRAT